MGTYRIVQAFLDPLVNFIRYLPVTSFVPLFILWIGIGIEQRVSVIIFGIFFQQLVMMADSARSVPRDLVNAAYTLGTSRSETVFHIVFPATLPNVLDILRVTMGWAWTYLVVAELVAARSGLGYISLKAMRGFQVDVIFMAIAHDRHSRSDHRPDVPLSSAASLPPGPIEDIDADMDTPVDLKSSDISVDHVVLRYGKGDNSVLALNDISLHVDHNEFCVIVGPSGCGKSSLALSDCGPRGAAPAARSRSAAARSPSPAPIAAWCSRPIRCFPG